jgi:hypothetical protein
MDQNKRRVKLDKMSLTELRNRAEAAGLDYPEDTDRLVIIDGLLSLMKNLDYLQGPAPRRVKQRIRIKLSEGEEDVEYFDVPEASPLPVSYNRSYIDALIRDPYWIFVWWDIREADRKTFTAMQNFKGYCICVRELDRNLNVVEDVFLMDITDGEKQRYLHYQTADIPLRLDLYAVFENERQNIASSRVLVMPPLLERVYKPDIKNLNEYRINLLSGYDDLTLMRNSDRMSHVPRRKPLITAVGPKYKR